METRLLACVLLACVGTVARPADFSGTWRIDLARGGGFTLHTYLVLRQEGDQLAGKVVINGGIDVPLRNAHFESGDALFGPIWGGRYRLHVDGERLRGTLTYGPGAAEDITAVRVPAAEAEPPAAIPLPPLAPVPANGLARTPPMGWNSWNHFADRVDDRIIRETADALVKSGLAAAGYVYVNIDDTWEAGRDAAGNLVPNAKFPDMKALADYVHQRGLKLGIYSSPGPVTCGGYPGSYGHEEQDARTFAAWGIDYLKYDWCSAERVYPDSALQAAYQKMGRALAACGRPIVYSLCEYGRGDVWTWGPQVGANLWRTTGDIQDNWASMSRIGFNQGRLAPYAGPGHWNDPDMLEVGNGGMTIPEYRTHFSLWCLLAAPLMAGNDLRTMSAETLEILDNREVIALDQDPLGRQGTPQTVRDGIEIWGKPLQDGGRAIGIFNRNDTDRNVALDWKEAGLPGTPWTARDLWHHRDLTPEPDGWFGTIPAHDVVLLRVRWTADP